MPEKVSWMPYAAQRVKGFDDDDDDIMLLNICVSRKSAGSRG